MKRRLALLLALLALVFPGISAAAENDYPGEEWRACTPEEQGMDSGTLLAMLDAIGKEKAPIHSVLVLRHGYLVLEAYFSPFHRDTRHDLFSATKSFTSALVGIAMAEGKIQGVHQKVTDLLPGIKIPENTLGLEDMTLENLLTMTAGHAADSTDIIYQSRDWGQDFFRQPFATRPGTRFLYDSSVSHLLAVILKKNTGEPVAPYAKARLFEPLGIGDFAWEKTAEGVHTGGWGLRMRPVDMARFGYLLLRNGVWDGRQVIPSQWIETAAKKHAEGWWGALRGDDYGYQFWVNPFGGFRADGFAGQMIYVVPEQDLVAVFTAGINYSETYQPARLMTDFVLPAIQSQTALPAGESGQMLAARLAELENPAPKAASALPDTAAAVSGKTYAPSGLFDSFALTFQGTEECTLTISQQGRRLSLPVGLDGVYRVTKATKLGTLVWYPPYSGVALRGHWADESTFVIDWQYLEEPYREEYRFTFAKDGAVMQVTEYVVGSAGPMMPYAQYQAALKK